MPTEVDEDLAERLTRYFALIVNNEAPAFPYEHEIRLFQLQNWIYFPKQGAFRARQAGFFAASLLLEGIERRISKGWRTEKGTAARYSKLFENTQYAKLFDATFGLSPGSYDEGACGWMKLLRTVSFREFDDELERKRASLEPILHIIDFLYRILKCSPDRVSDAKIGKAQYYVWKDKKLPKEVGLLSKPISGKYIKQRWSDMKASAIFVYVSERHNYDFFPRSVQEKGFLRNIRLEAQDKNKIIAYLRDCHAVGTLLSRYTDLPWPFEMPGGPAEYHAGPEVMPLSSQEFARIDDYKTGRQEFIDN